MRTRTTLAATLLLALAAGGCGPAEDRTADTGPMPSLGPADGLDLPPTDLDRVRVGDPAPDFTLASLEGPRVTLSDYRGSQDVVLVFYRGHW